MPEEPVLHSRRTLTLRFDIPISRTKRFWEALKEDKFVTTKCTKCGNVTFPPQSDCSKCMSNEFEWIDLGREATLLTYTHVQITPASFVDSDPYLIAIAEFPVGVKVLAWLEGLAREAAKPGMRLRVESRGIDEGNPYYVFVPA
jgi:uncharacterized OB-fold protein